MTVERDTHSRLDPQWFRKRIFWQAISDIIAGTTWLSADEAYQRFQMTCFKFLLNTVAIERWNFYLKPAKI